MLHIKIAHHFLHKKQNLMMCLLMKQIIFTLQCLCTIWLNIVIIIQLHQLHLWQFKRHDVPVNNVDLTTNNSKLFKYKTVLVGKTADVADGNSFVENTKIVFPLKYLSNFWRISEISLINCKIHLKLNWIEDWIFYQVLETQLNLK